MLGWNIDHIINRLGGTRGVIDLCACYAPAVIPPKPDTITLWKFRRRISALWLPVVVCAWIDKGFPAEELFVVLPDAPPVPEDDDTGPESCGL